MRYLQALSSQVFKQIFWLLFLISYILGISLSQALPKNDFRSEIYVEERQLAAKSSDNEHYGEQDHGIPKIVFYQVLNFLLFMALLFFLLRDKIKTFYQNRYNLFQEQFKAARKEREDMQAAYEDYQQKLQEISTTSEDQVRKAKQESNEMKIRMLKDADLESQRIKNEAQALLDLEHKKARRLVQAEFVEKVISSVQGNIAKDMSDEDRKSLIKKFEVSLK